MKKIAIISNYNEKCGIAQYTENIVKGFSRYKEDVQVDIIKIDTSLVNSTRKIHKLEKIEHWKEIARNASKYDAVNIQFENGIFGSNNNEVLKNLKVIFSSNKNISITMHTVIYDLDEKVGIFEFCRNIAKLKARKAMKCLANTLNKSFLERFMTLVSKYPSVRIIVHTEREKFKLTRMYGYRNIVSHPLAFTGEVERNVDINRPSLEQEYGFGNTDKIITIYGFISKYKGHLTAIKALKNLPEDYKLLVVGAAHPASIKAFKPIDDYLSKIIKEVELLKLSDRVSFAGSVSDEELMNIMRSTDISVFPYLEVGQSASGPATMQLELGGRALFSGAHVFTELDKYSDGTLERFDIGNYLQLSKLILKSMEKHPCKENEFNKKFSLSTLIDFYTENLLGR